MTATKEASESHFDAIAAEYDHWKRKNWYYYKNLITLYREYIPGGVHVLEIGCGTGDILASLNPREGRGIDISGEMVSIAQKKYGSRGELTFKKEDITAEEGVFPEDYVYLADVLEHVGHMPSFLQHLARRVKKDATVVISIANPLWEPLLMLAEKFGMKMPEGPHKRFSIKETERYMQTVGFSIEEKGFRLLIPKPFPGADWINARFHRFPLLRRVGFIVYWVLKIQ